MNTWNHRSTPNSGLGLERVELLVPDAGAVATVRTRLVGDGVSVTAVDDGLEVTDPERDRDSTAGGRLTAALPV